MLSFDCSSCCDNNRDSFEIDKTSNDNILLNKEKPILGFNITSRPLAFHYNIACSRVSVKTMSKVPSMLLLAVACILISVSSIDAFCATKITHDATNRCRTANDQQPLSEQHFRTSSSLFSLAQLIDEPLAWNAVIGEADRAFRRGNQLDKSGQPRLASQSFHEASTLFQCFLELPENFGHVTNLSREDCQAVLAYTLVRLAFISAEALSDANAAVRLYQ